MKRIEIIVGTTLGASEYIADHLQEKFNDLNISSQIYLDPSLDQLNRDPDTLWLICTSTYGAGELPENIKPLYKQLKNNKLNLDNTHFSIIALGDSNYDTFCQAGITMSQILCQNSAKQLDDPLHIDVTQHPIPEDAIDLWFPNWVKNIQHQQ